MRADLERFMENNRWTTPKSPLSYLQCKAIHLNGVQTRLKCKPNVKRCKRFVFPSHSPLLHHNALTTKTISHFQADHILTRFVFPPLHDSTNSSIVRCHSKEIQNISIRWAEEKWKSIPSPVLQSPIQVRTRWPQKKKKQHGMQLLIKNKR